MSNIKFEDTPNKLVSVDIMAGMVTIYDLKDATRCKIMDALEENPEMDNDEMVAVVTPYLATSGVVNHFLFNGKITHKQI